jgi:cell division protease FtsH
VMAATNRPETLDSALMRPGRFDRQVGVDRPDLLGREAVLVVHSRKIKLSEAVDLKAIAQLTPGMAGADLANVLNEAALAAGRRGGHTVTAEDMEESVDRMQLGLKRRGRAMSEDEKRRVAYHEAGHALVAMSLEHTDPVHRVTIIPRSIGALGATLQLPTEDRYLVTQPELEDQICVMLGGRTAERAACGELSSGAQNDLERATETARQMVCRFGMSESLGAATYGRSTGSRYLDSPFGMERNFSEESARAIDSEVTRILDEQEGRAIALIRKQRSSLESIVIRLLEEETLEHDALVELVERSARVAS